MKNFFTTALTCIAILCCTKAFSQDYTIREQIGENYNKRTRGLAWAQEFKSGFEYKGKNYVIAEQREIGQFFFLLGTYQTEIKSDLFVYMLDDSMNVTGRKNISPAKGLDITYKKYQRCGNRLLVFWESINKNKKTTELFCTSYDLENWTTKTMWLNQVPNKNEGKFMVVINDDEQQFTVIRQTKKSEDTATGMAWEVSTYSNTIELLNSRDDIQLHLQGETLESAQVAFNGDLFVLTSGKTLDEDENEHVSHTLYMIGDGEPVAVDLSTEGEDNVLVQVNPYLPGDSTAEVIMITKDGSGDLSASFAVYNRKTGNSTAEKSIDGLPVPSMSDNSANNTGGIGYKKGVSRTKSSYFERNADGTYVLFLENYHTWSQTVQTQRTVTDQNGRYLRTEYSTKTYYHYVYGPGILTHIDMKTGKASSTTVSYSKDFTNYDPGRFVTPRLLDVNTYGLFSSESYAICNQGDRYVSMTGLNNATGKDKFYAWTELVPMETGFIQVYRKGGKNTRFSALKLEKN